MPSVPFSEVSRRLAALQVEASREFAARTARPPAVPAIKRSSARRRTWSSYAWRAVTVAALLVAPFVLLVRGSVVLYARFAWPSWLALLLAGTATLLVITAYGAWLAHRLTGRMRLALVAKWVAAPLVLGFCGHALLFLSRTNVKAGPLQTEYRTTHPLLRIALSTLILANDDLVVTDLSRLPADYARMGLPLFDATLHVPQRDGWVHAVDLRTTGRSEITNRLVELYFRVMGFRTLRHVGTADHLHVELPVR
jgi:hypothetical protein